MGIIGEAFGAVPVRPSTFLLQGLGQVPVVKCDGGGYAMLQQPVEQLPVKVDALLVVRPGAVGLDPRPSHGKPVRVDPQSRHERDILLPAFVVVTCYIARVPMENLSRRMAKSVPDGRPAPVFIDGPFDLVRSGGRPPQKPIGKIERYSRDTTSIVARADEAAP